MAINWKNCFKIGATIFILFLCIRHYETVQVLLIKAISASVPLIAGFILAYIVNIIMSFYEKHYFPVSKKKFVIKTRRPLCAIFAFVTLFAIIALIISLILPELIECINLVISEIPGAIGIGVKWLDQHHLVTDALVSELTKINWQSRIDEIVTMTFNYFGNVVNLISTIVTTVFSGVISALLAIIFSFYILLSKDRLIAQFNSLIDGYLKENIRKKVRYVCHVLNESFHKYIVGQCTESVILGILCTIGMMILRLPYATMIGALVAFTALIPIVGAYAGAIIGAFMIAMVNPLDAVIFIVFLVILQQFEGNIIYPRVVGTSVGLPAIWVLVAVTIGGSVAGIAGMLIGVPLAASIYRIIRHDIKKRLKEQTTTQTE